MVGAVEAGTSVNTTNSYGQVYVYDLSSGTPTIPVVTLTSPSPIPSFKFGWSVAISGTRVVVGAYWTELFGSDQGRAYVYDLSGPAPATPVAAFSNPSPVAGDNFARSVAISGNRVAVAVPLFDAGIGLTDVGRVYVYDLDSATPTVPTATLNDPGPGAGLPDNFGSSLAMSGTQLVVGASQDTVGSIRGAGSAYVFDFNSGTPTTPTAILNNPASG